MRVFGALFFENERVVVVLNGVRGSANLGPLQPVVRKHIEPEADYIWIFPRKEVDRIQILEEG
jgi:hypothetical protein